MTMVLDREPAENKLLLSMAAGGAVTIAAGAICWFCGSDLAGGASLSEHSLRAAGAGLIAAAPLAAGRLMFWNEPAAQSLPPLAYLQRGKVEAFRPLISNLTPAQVCLLLDCYSHVPPHRRLVVALQCMLDLVSYIALIYTGDCFVLNQYPFVVTLAQQL